MTMNAKEILDLIETARETGKIKKGVNEATKAVERGVAKVVVIADDVSPKEILMHFTPLCEEKNSVLLSVPSKNELGRAAGLSVPTSAVAIVDAGEAAKKIKELGK